MPDFDTRSETEEIRREVLALHQENYGTGASNISVQIHPDLVVIVIDVELSIAERTLLGAGEGQAVKAMRESFQVAVTPTFKAIIERATGRRVVSFFSGMNLDPVYSIELFRLEPVSPR
jgi:uncharacterized protein YbcI